MKKGDILAQCFTLSIQIVRRSPTLSGERSLFFVYRPGGGLAGRIDWSDERSRYVFRATTSLQGFSSDCLFFISKFLRRADGYEFDGPPLEEREAAGETR